jgi:ubiquinone biosynthesis protein
VKRRTCVARAIQLTGESEISSVFRNLTIDFQRLASLFIELLRLAIGVPWALLGHGDPPQVRLRVSLQRLGMTYLKLGQFLALRIDLLPREWCAELSRLFEQVTPMRSDDVRSIIESESGNSLENLFREFRWQPLASASVAQVHEAVTVEGDRVAVKVQRKDLEVYFGADMRNIRHLAVIVDALGLIGALNLAEVAREFEHYTMRELDFVAEGSAADRFRKQAVSGELVPRVFWALTTHRMLTMEFIEGISLARVKTLVDSGRSDALESLLPGIDLREAMRNLTAASLHQLLISGFFHADLHPGNVLLCPNNRVALLDCGIFGSVSVQKREQLANHLEQVALGNIDESFRHYASMYVVTEKTDYEQFERECKAILRSWVEAIRETGTPVEKRLVAGFAETMFAVVRRHHLIVGMDTLLFWRAMIILDATVLQLCPSFDLLQELRAFFVKYRPGLLARIREIGSLESAPAAINFAGEIPDLTAELLASATKRRLNPIVRMDESGRLRRANNDHIETLALACFGVSLALLRRAVWPGAARITVVVLALGCLFSAALRVTGRPSPHSPPQKKPAQIDDN